MDQTIIEIPPIQPLVVGLRTYACHCPQCNRRVSSTHPLKVSEATGAAGVHLGPNALAWAITLNKQYGLSMHKTSRMLGELTHVALTPGGLSQAVDRVALRFESDYQQAEEQLRSASAVYVDETSWWVGEPGWWLWVFANSRQTLYKVRKSRARKIVIETLGEHFAGTLVSDCLSIYDEVNASQQKCYAHHLKAIRKALDQEAESDFLIQCRSMLQAAMSLKAIQAQLPVTEVQKMHRALKATAERLLSHPREGPEESIRNRLAKQQDHLFTFLEHESVEATNNLAERQLRPAVIARKISCGNKTPNGARSWEILSSLAATCAQTDESFTELIARRMALASRPQSR